MNWWLLASAALSAAATVTIAAFFTVGQPWGSVNDLCYAGQALAMLGALPALRAADETGGPSGGRGTWRFGIVAWGGFAVTSLLVAAEGLAAMAGASISLPGVPYAFLAISSLFFLMTEAWLPMAGRRLERAGLKGAWRLSLLALTGVGFPVFAAWLAKHPALAPGAPVRN
jgi:hypothetical protein